MARNAIRKDALRLHAAATRQEAGCLFFDQGLSVDQPDTVMFVECFKSAEAHEVHQATPHMRVFMANAADMIAEAKFENILSDNVATDGF